MHVVAAFSWLKQDFHPAAPRDLPINCMQKKLKSGKRGQEQKWKFQELREKISQLTKILVSFEENQIICYFRETKTC